MSIFLICVIILIGLLLIRIYNNHSNTEKILSQVKLLKEYMEVLKSHSKKHESCKIPYKVYYINMDRDKNRRQYMESQLKNISNNYERIKGFNGYKIKNINEDIIDNISFMNDYNDLTKAEIGCTISHIKAIHKAFIDNVDIAFICEDDISFDTCSIAPSLNSVVNNSPKDWEILQLWSDSTSMKDEEIPNFPNIKYIKRNHNNSYWGATAYIINRKGIEKIVSHCVKSGIYCIIHSSFDIDFPKQGTADYYIYDLANTYCIIPSIFIPNNSILESTIHPDHTPGHINSALRAMKKYIEKIGYTSNHYSSYVDIWDKTIFKPNKKELVNYIVSYNLQNSQYKSYCNILLDGEPTNLIKTNPDVIITTKKELLPENIPSIYVPQFVFSFIEKGFSPEDLLFSNNIPKKTKFCVFNYSNCDDSKEGVAKRKEFFYKLNKKSGNRVDNIGKCYNDNYVYNGDWGNNVELYKPYKFVIAFENTQLLGYITEKITLSMLARSIPIYFGAPDVNRYFNSKSFINVNDFDNIEDCIDYILKVDKDNNLYNEIINQPYFPNNEIDTNLFSPYYGKGIFFEKLKKIMKDLNFLTLSEDIR